MMFSEKLQSIRKSKGYTREEPAEILSVSRQAAAKRESGQVYADISNLFNVTVDYLVNKHICGIHE